MELGLGKMFMVMKKTFVYIMAAVAAIAAVSCQKNEIESTPAYTPMTLTASFENDTRTAINGTSVTWVAGDKIVVIDEYSNSDTFTLSAGAGTKNGTFTQDNNEVLEGQLYAVYGTTNVGYVETDKILFSIPAEQDGSFASANICVAKASGTTLAFKNATAIVKVVGSANLHYFSISTTGRCAGYMFAEFVDDDLVVSVNTHTDTGASSSISKGTKLIPDGSYSVTSLSGSYYFAVAPNVQYSFSSESYTSKGNPAVVHKVKEFSSPENKPMTLERNKIYTITPTFK